MEFFVGATRTEVIPSELFGEFLLRMNDPRSLLDVGFGWEPMPAFACRFERNAVLPVPSACGMSQKH